jgi:hypothetical protein
MRIALREIRLPDYPLLTWPRFQRAWGSRAKNPNTNVAGIYQSATPTSPASACQCLGCGLHRPARIATAYVTDTLSTDMMTGFAISLSSG